MVALHSHVEAQQHIPYRKWCRHCVAARESNPVHRGRRFATAVEEDKDMKQVSYGCCFMRDQPVRISKDPGVERPHFPNGVSSCGTNERGNSLVGGPTVRSRFGTTGTLWSGHIEI